MSGKIGLFFVLVLAVSLACDAREFAAALRNKAPGISVLRLKTERGLGVAKEVGGNDNLCGLCEEYAGEALNYLQQNKTQKEVLTVLHESCSKLLSLKQQCMTMVDYYIPIFFLEVSTIQPKEFCRKVNFCKEVVSYVEEFKQNSCDVCHLAVSEAVSLLKDPENQLEILQVLLKECKAVEKYLPKCKTMVFEYAPLILANAEQFLEKEDICTKLHACDVSHGHGHGQSSMVSDN